MFVKLSSDVVINTDYITAIEPHEGKNIVNSNDKPVKYIVHMVDDQHWYLAEEDFVKLVLTVSL